MFQAILSNLTKRIRGARWAMVVGVDGVLLETMPATLPDGELFAAEYAAFYRSARRATAQTGGDDVATAALITRHGKLMFQFLTPEYFLILALDPSGNSGKASFETARVRGMLERELVF
jgi:predicted regulator of Ras-like GTPase activity (Roadblock/LC7/MglB family)